MRDLRTPAKVSGAAGQNQSAFSSRLLLRRCSNVGPVCQRKKVHVERVGSQHIGFSLYNSWSSLSPSISFLSLNSLNVQYTQIAWRQGLHGMCCPAEDTPSPVMLCIVQDDPCHHRSTVLFTQPHVNVKRVRVGWSNESASEKLWKDSRTFLESAVSQHHSLLLYHSSPSSANQLVQ